MSCCVAFHNMDGMTLNRVGAIIQSESLDRSDMRAALIVSLCVAKDRCGCFNDLRTELLHGELFRTTQIRTQTNPKLRRQPRSIHFHIRTIP